jgi:ribose-phosphate pyrophosphokinase
MKIICGTTSKTIGKDLSESLKIPIVNTKIKRFPDGELYVRILDKIKNDNVILIQNSYPDLNIIELLLLQDAIKESGANKIFTIIPYFGYSRQDKIFENGEVISAKTLARHISLNSDEIITIDPHKEHILDFFSKPASSISAINDISEYLKNKEIDLLLAPDKGAVEGVKKASKIIGCNYDYMEKKRIDGYNIKIKPKKLEVKNKNIAIIDDIISTGGTMAKSIIELKKQYAKKVYVACTHGLFAGDAIKILNSARCDEIISTDTIISQYSKVKIFKALTKYLKFKKLL